MVVTLVDDSTEPELSITCKCMRKAHPVEVTIGMIGINSMGNAFKVRCPVVVDEKTGDLCGSPVPISKEKVADLMGLKGDDRSNVIKIFKDRYGAGSGESPKGSAEKDPVPDGDDDGTDGTDDDETMNGTDDDELHDGEDDGTVSSGEEIYEPIPPAPQANPRVAPARRPAAPARAAAPIPRPARSPAPAPVARAPVLLEEETAELTPRDILIAVIEDSGLPPQEVGQLSEWINLANDDYWDYQGAEELFKRFRLSSAMIVKLVNRFRNQMELHRKRMARNEDLVRFVAGRGDGGNYGQQHPAGFPISVRGSDPMGAPGAVTRGPGGVPPTDPCTAAIQAIIATANGVITPQVIQAIDAVRAAYGQTGAAPAGLAGIVPQAANVQELIQRSQAQTLDAVKSILETNQQKKTTEEERAKEKADLEKRFGDMQNTIMMAIAAMKSNPQPVAPSEGETREQKLFEMMLKLVETKNTATATAGQDRMDKLFDKLFDLTLENVKAKPTEAMAPVQDKLAALEEQISRIGGGFAGLPTNSDQLHGVIDYMKATADIKRTEAEFADKAANRELISSVATNAVSAIGEAVAAVFMQNAGTPQEKPVTLKEQPIDDGSVVSVLCPQCGTVMTAPKNAPLIRCPNCNSKFEREKHQITEEQLEELRQQAALAEMERRIRARDEAAAAGQGGPQVAEDNQPLPLRKPPVPVQPQVPPQQPQPQPQQVPSQKPADPKSVGPLSSMVMDLAAKQQARPDLVPTLGPNAVVTPAPAPAPSPAPTPIPEVPVHEESAGGPADSSTELPQEPAGPASETDISVPDEHSATEQNQQ